MRSRIRWAGRLPGGPQLLVVPRAGEWANAFYERESRSLQFFYFSPSGESRRIYTSHSQDIVAHETAHAILDGIALGRNQLYLRDLLNNKPSRSDRCY